MKKENKYILIFDGACVLCNNWTRFVIKRDHKFKFVFAAMQSPIGIQLLEEHGISTIDPSTFLLLKNNNVYTSSDAMLEVIKEFSLFWRTLLLLRLIPKSLRDRFYHLIARNRYGWFGKKEVCLIPAGCDPERFV